MALKLIPPFARYLARHHLKSVLIWTILLVVTSSYGQSTKRDDNIYMIHDRVKDLQYSTYLTQVINILKKDPKIHAKIHFEKLSTGNAGEHYKDIEPIVQLQLDDLKRGELRRINKYAAELKRLGHSDKNVIKSQMKQALLHVDTKSGQFGKEDLRKLILQAKGDLTVIDNFRKERFKVYEMHKMLEFEELFKRLPKEQQAQVAKVREEVLLEHRRRKPSHLPGSKEHLMKVWQEKDKMDKENFNIKTFFHMHDLNGDGFLNEDEIKTLLEAEVEEYHDPEDKDFDKKVKEEDLERMREYVFENVDRDGDHLINIEEFIANAKKTGFDDHIFWEHVKKVPLFTQEEYKRFADSNRDEVNKLIDEGKISLPLSGFVKHEEDPIINDEEEI